MEAYHGAEVCEILVLLLLNNSTNKFGKYNFVYIETDDGLD